MEFPTPRASICEQGSNDWVGIGHPFAAMPVDFGYAGLDMLHVYEEEICIFHLHLLAHVYVHCLRQNAYTAHVCKYVRTKTKLLILLLMANIRVLIANYQHSLALLATQCPLRVYPLKSMQYEPKDFSGRKGKHI